jgi:hypothetical protein
VRAHRPPNRADARKIIVDYFKINDTALGDQMLNFISIACR